METRRYLRCLGQPALFGPSGEPIRFRTRKHLALLVYLAVEGRVRHRRDRLAELLWPKVSLAEGRHSLATALSVLRPRLGPGALEADRETVGLSPDVVMLDIDRLLAGDVLGGEVHDPLEVAGFLEGFEIPDSGEFAHWKDRQQARLLPAIKGGLLVLMDRCRRTGNSRQIEQLADRMLALDELSEEAIRAKMEARAFAGDRLTALQIFEQWKLKLAEELGAAPSQLVEGIAVRLRRRGWERTTHTHIPSVPTDQWRDRPFIGRGAEYQVLYEAWEGLRKGVDAHTLVLGDSGVGKTTLVGRLLTAAGLQGAAISRVQCYDLDIEIPYATLGNLIHGLLDRPEVTATAPDALAELARTVPEVRRRFPSIPTPHDSQGENARVRLSEAFHQLLLALAEEHPVILVVDDVHLADEASLAVLQLVMRMVQGQAVMVVLIARPAELLKSTHAVQLRTGADKLKLREIELPPMNDEDSAVLLRHLIPDGEAQPSSSCRRALLRSANGFPMVLELLMRDWQQYGQQSLVLTMNAMTAEVGTGDSTVAVFRQVFDRTAQALDPTTRNVLNLAAISGHRLNDMRLYAIADLSIGQVMAGMGRLTNARLLRDNGRGLEFANEVLRTAAYLEVPSPVRKALHARLADFLIEDARAGTRGLGLEIAWHCLRAGRGVDASSYLLQGAQDAIDTGALDSAERALSTALPHLPCHDKERAALLLTEVLQEQGRWSESAAILLEHHLTATSSLATVFSLLADHRTSSSRVDHIRADVSRLSAIAATEQSHAIRVKAIRAASRLMPDLRDERLAGELILTLDVIADSSLSEDERTQLEVTKAQLLYHAGDRAGSLAQLTLTLTRTEQKGMVNSSLAEMYTGLGALRCHEGRYRDALADFLKADAVLAQIGNELGQTSIASQIALCHGRLGEYAEQIAWSRKASEGLMSTVTGYQRLQPAYYEAFALAMRGDIQGSIERMAKLDGEARLFSSEWLVQAWKLAKADILYLTGQPAAGLELAREGTHYPRPTLHATSFAGAFARWLGLLLAYDTSSLDAGAQLKALFAGLERYDALDQLEILLAYRTVCPASERLRIDCELATRKALLPQAVILQLRRLGYNSAVS